MHPPPQVWPTLRATDALALIRFLVDVVGFEETVVYADGRRRAPRAAVLAARRRRSCSARSAATTATAGRSSRAPSAPTSWWTTPTRCSSGSGPAAPRSPTSCTTPTTARATSRSATPRATAGRSARTAASRGPRQLTRSRIGWRVCRDLPLRFKWRDRREPGEGIERRTGTCSRFLRRDRQCHVLRWIALACRWLTAAGLAVTATSASAKPRRRARAGRAAAASAPSHAYRANDYADGRAMSILPPGENGLVNATDAAAFELNGTRPANSHDQLGKYANLLYGYPSADRLDSSASTTTTSRSACSPADVTRTETPDDRRHDLPRQARRPAHLRRHRPDHGLRRRLRAGRGPAVPDGRAAPLRRGHAGVVPRLVVRVRADGPRPAAARAVHAGAGASRRSTRCRRSTARRARWPSR